MASAYGYWKPKKVSNFKEDDRVAPLEVITTLWLHRYRDQQYHKENASARPMVPRGQKSQSPASPVVKKSQPAAAKRRDVGKRQRRQEDVAETCDLSASEDEDEDEEEEDQQEEEDPISDSGEMSRCVS